MSVSGQQETHALQQFNRLLDHIVGAGKQRLRVDDDDPLLPPEVPDHLELGRAFALHEMLAHIVQYF